MNNTKSRKDNKIKNNCVSVLMNLKPSRWLTNTRKKMTMTNTSWKMIFLSSECLMTTVADSSSVWVKPSVAVTMCNVLLQPTIYSNWSGSTQPVPPLFLPRLLHATKAAGCDCVSSLTSSSHRPERMPQLAVAIWGFHPGPAFDNPEMLLASSNTSSDIRQSKFAAEILRS